MRRRPGTDQLSPCKRSRFCATIIARKVSSRIDCRACGQHMPQRECLHHSYWGNVGILQANKQLESKSKIYLNSLNACVHFCFQVNSDIDMFHFFFFFAMTKTNKYIKCWYHTMKNFQVISRITATGLLAVADYSEAKVCIKLRDAWDVYAGACIKEYQSINIWEFSKICVQKQWSTRLLSKHYPVILCYKSSENGLVTHNIQWLISIYWHHAEKNINQLELCPKTIRIVSIGHRCPRFMTWDTEIRVVWQPEYNSFYLTLTLELGTWVLRGTYQLMMVHISAK